MKLYNISGLLIVLFKQHMDSIISFKLLNHRNISFKAMLLLDTFSLNSKLYSVL